MYFLRFFGSSDVDHVLDAMEYAVYVHDVEHIILDNLQFMMSGQGRGYDKFEMQDRAIERFRQFATSKNVHVTLVIHPRKEGEGEVLGLNSVFGSAKATQEADNVLIIQQTPAYRCLDVKKNRFDGETGSIPFAFNKALSRVVELTPQEVMSLETKVSEGNQQSHFQKNGNGNGNGNESGGQRGAPFVRRNVREQVAVNENNNNGGSGTTQGDLGRLQVDGGRLGLPHRNNVVISEDVADSSPSMTDDDLASVGLGKEEPPTFSQPRRSFSSPPPSSHNDDQPGLAHDVFAQR